MKHSPVLCEYTGSAFSSIACWKCPHCGASFQQGMLPTQQVYCDGFSDRP